MDCACSMADREAGTAAAVNKVAIPDSLGTMKVALVLGLVLLMVLAGLPFVMGYTSEMADCPACASPGGPSGLGLCAGILAMAAFTARLGSRRVGLAGVTARRVLVVTAIFRPPRLA